MKQTIREFRSLLRSAPPILVALMVLSVVGMNLLANKSINTGVDWLALDCGILFSWLAFLSMDVLTQCYGPRATTLMSAAALALNLLMAAVFFVASRVPGVWGESYVEGSEAVINRALDATFGGTWYVIAGSSVAFLVSALLNNFLNYGIGMRMKRADGFGVYAARSYISTFLAQVVDNMVFALLVCRVFFGWTLLQCFTCSLTGAVVELLCEVLFSPMGYRISRGLLARRAEALPAGEG